MCGESSVNNPMFVPVSTSFPRYLRAFSWLQEKAHGCDPAWNMWCARTHPALTLKAILRNADPKPPSPQQAAQPPCAASRHNPSCRCQAQESRRRRRSSSALQARSRRWPCTRLEVLCIRVGVIGEQQWRGSAGFLAIGEALNLAAPTLLEMMHEAMLEALTTQASHCRRQSIRRRIFCARGVGPRPHQELIDQVGFGARAGCRPARGEGRRVVVTRLHQSIF